jgi:hypothetical protein
VRSSASASGVGTGSRSPESVSGRATGSRSCLRSTRALPMLRRSPRFSAKPEGLVPFLVCRYGGTATPGSALFSGLATCTLTCIDALPPDCCKNGSLLNRKGASGLRLYPRAVIVPGGIATKMTSAPGPGENPAVIVPGGIATKMTSAPGPGENPAVIVPGGIATRPDQLQDDDHPLACMRTSAHDLRHDGKCAKFANTSRREHEDRIGEVS